jgi:hypothetical protein
MLGCGVSSRGSMYFKFENMWLMSEGFCGASEHMVDVLQFSRISCKCAS